MTKAFLILLLFNLWYNTIYVKLLDIFCNISYLFGKKRNIRYK